MTDFTRREAIVALAMLPAMGSPARRATTMLTKPIPSSKEQLPVIGLGTWQVKITDELLQAFVDGGGRVIDSSPMYGSAERDAGDVIARLTIRPKLFVATKVWTSGKLAGVRQMEDSERLMRSKPLDLMQVHNLVDVETHLDTLAVWKREGRVRYVGITHYTAGSHDAVARIVAKRPVDFVQINYSVGEREAENRLLPLCRDRGVAVIANRPFASGDLFRNVRSKPLPAWASEIDATSWAQILLKFVVSHPAITVAIPATSRVAHIHDNLGAGSGRMPNEALRRRIASEIG
jgi:diketogulonate reductase-like aldo/keto reductase